MISFRNDEKRLSISPLLCLLSGQFFTGLANGTHLKVLIFKGNHRDKKQGKPGGILHH